MERLFVVMQGIELRSIFAARCAFVVLSVVHILELWRNSVSYGN